MICSSPYLQAHSLPESKDEIESHPEKAEERAGGGGWEAVGEGVGR